MMNSIVKEKQESFKALEQKFFAYVCDVNRYDPKEEGSVR